MTDIEEPDWDFTITIPDGWFVRDIELDTREATTRREVDERIAAQPELAPLRDSLVERLLAFAAEADEKWALVCATWFDVVEGVTVAANVMVFYGERKAPDSVDQELEVLVRDLAERDEGDVADRQVEVVHLPAGRAVRVRAVRKDAPSGGRNALLVDSVQYWVPVPGHPGMVLISATTPNLALGEELGQVFDDIAATLELVL